MEKSNNYHQHQKYMREMRIPTFTEIRASLGEEVANLVINECPDVLKEHMGIEPKLEGAGENLWTSPSDLLMGLVVLKPPFTNRHIKALTHEGILSIGGVIEEKFRNEMEQKCKAALADQKEMLVFIAEQEQIKAVRDVYAERTKYYEEKFKVYQNDFEQRLQEELELLTTRLLTNNETILEVQKEQMEAEWQDKLLIEVEETTKNLTLKFLEDLQTQEDDLTRKFEVDLKKQESRYETRLELEQTICKETLKQLKHNLECKNISNLLYVLCMERRKCERDRIDTEEQHRKQVAELQIQADTSNNTIAVIQAELNKEKERIVIRDKCLKEILKQFQKFVYYALRAAPKQGEFLLNVEKLLMYELAESVVNFGKKKTVKIPDDVEQQRRQSSEPEDLEPQDLTLPPYHSCLDELDIPDDDNDANELFSVILDKKIYVREDFRNMISQGIELDPTNDLWNHDVEQLIAMLKTSVEKIAVATNIPSPLPCPVHPVLVKPTFELEPTALHIQEPALRCPHLEEISSKHTDHSRRSSVYFAETGKDSPPKQQYVRPAALPEIPSDEQQLLTECLLNNEPVNAEELTQFVEYHRRSSILLCAKDSLEHHRISIKVGSAKDDDAASRDTDRISLVEFEFPEASMEKLRKIHQKEMEADKEIIKENKAIDEVLMMMSDELAQNSAEKSTKPHVKEQEFSTARRNSGFSMVQDSLELIRTTTKNEVRNNFLKVLNKTLEPLNISDDTEVLEPVNAEEVETKEPSPAHSYTSKRDRISIKETPISISNHSFDDMEKDDTVNFIRLPKTYHTHSIVVNQDAAWKMYQKKDEESETAASARTKSPHRVSIKRDDFLQKPNIGAIEGSETYLNFSRNAFAADRVQSILGILKEDPSLMRIFTSGSR